MMPVEITKDEILVVYPKVAQTMAYALGCDVKRVALNVQLIAGLGAESLDFLDIVFRLERAFKVKIPRGKIVARGHRAGPGDPLRARESEGTGASKTDG